MRCYPAGPTPLAAMSLVPPSPVEGHADDLALLRARMLEHLYSR
jgi:hypothetical protein